MAKQEIKPWYDEQTEGTVQDCAQGLNVSPSMVYVALRESPHKIEPSNLFRPTHAKGRPTKVYRFEDMETCYNAWIESKGAADGEISGMEDHYNLETHARLDDYAARDDVPYTKSQLYVMVKATGLKPEFKWRKPGKKGRGSPIYLITDLANMIETYKEQKDNQYPSTYDADTYVTQKGIGEMLPTEWGVNQSTVSGLVRILGLQVDHKYRKPGSKQPAGLYRRADVQRSIDELRAIRAKNA